MQECDRSLNPLSLTSRWIKEFVGGWVDESRHQGYDQSPLFKAYIDAVEHRFHTQPVSAGNALEKAIESGREEGVTRSLDKISTMRQSDQNESLCSAKRINSQAAAIDSNLPDLDLVTGTVEGHRVFTGIAVKIKYQKLYDLRSLGSAF